MVAETKNFSKDELKCSCCGEYGVQQWALDKLQTIREEFSRPMKVTSSYRCEKHPNERTKQKLGTHTQGIAFDIYVADATSRYDIVSLGIKHGANGIGVANNFVHLDFRDTTRVVWLYG